MNHDLLDVFRQHSIRVFADGPELVLRGKATPDVVAYARKHKAEIMALLTKPKAPPPPAKPLDRRPIALAALRAVERDPAVQFKVWRAAMRHEQDWGFLVQDHGYPVGWFLLSHIDNFLRLHHGRGIATEEMPDGQITHWEIVEIKP